MMLLISYDFPPDIRVEKEARALIAAGHQITLVCENRKNRPARKTWRGIDIIRLKPQPVWWRRLNTAYLFLALKNPVWEKQIARLIEEERPDAIHVHDLPFVGAGVRLAKKFNLPLVADLHENFPAWLEFRRGITTNPLEKLTFSPARFAAFEREILPRCDYIIVVVDEAAARVQALGLPPDKIRVVGNTEDTQAIPPPDQAVTLPPSKLTLLYVGGIGPDRGLDTAIKAMPQICRQVPDASLVVVGDGISRAPLERLTAQLNLTGVVTFEGYQPFNRVHSYIQASDICLVPHVASPEINTTIPHKLFQYMVMKKPVLVSSAKPLARIVTESNSGAVFQSGDPNSFAAAALQLRNLELRRTMGQNGHRAVMQKYNWQQDGKVLTGLYQTLAQKMERKL